MLKMAIVIYILLYISMAVSPPQNLQENVSIIFDLWYERRQAIFCGFGLLCTYTAGTTMAAYYFYTLHWKTMERRCVNI